MGCYMTMLQMPQDYSTVVSAMLANSFSTSTWFAMFELIKFICFGSTLSCPHKELHIPRLLRNRTKYNQLPPRSKVTRSRPAPADIAVRVPVPAPQMRVPATYTG